MPSSNKDIVALLIVISEFAIYLAVVVQCVDPTDLTVFAETSLCCDHIRVSAMETHA